MIRGIANIIFGILYFGIGVLILIKKWFLTELNENAALTLGIIFIVYGVFRIYRAVKEIRN